MKILVTGATGFVGSYLLEYLRGQNIDLCGTSLNKIPDGFKELFPGHRGLISPLDLKSKDSVKEAIKKIKPDAIIHLAALSSPNDSWDILEEMLTNNMLGQLNILEAVRNTNPKIKVITVSSGQVYGAVKPSEVPLVESHPIKPNNPYASSKVFQETLSNQYFYNYGIPTLIMRPLNHIGPRQSGNFAVPSFVKQIVEIEKGLKEPIIKVGNLEAQRDFMDVRDVCRAYYLAVIKGVPGEAYNLGSGKAYKMSKILDLLIAESTTQIKVEVDSKLFRPSDMPILLSDYSKFKAATGWEPKYKIEETLKDILEYWRNK